MCDTNPVSLAALLGTTLTIGTMVAYGFQVVALARARSGQGISFMTLCLNMIGSGFSLTGVMIRGGQAFYCLSSLSMTGLMSAMPVIQGIVSFVSTLFVLVTYCVVEYKQRTGRPRTVLAVSTGLAFLVAFALSILNLIVGIAGDAEWHLKLSGTLETFGLLSSLVTCMVWVPQLVYTLTHRGQSSLSWTMLALEAVGSFFMTIYLSLLIKPQFAWYVWFPFLVGGFLQAIILFVLYYRQCLEPGMDSLEIEYDDDDMERGTEMELTLEDIDDPDTTEQSVEALESPRKTMSHNPFDDEVDVQPNEAKTSSPGTVKKKDD